MNCPGRPTCCSGKVGPLRDTTIGLWRYERTVWSSTFHCFAQRNPEGPELVNAPALPVFLSRVNRKPETGTAGSGPA